MKPENRFIQAVHRLLPSEVYAEKTYNTLRGGTPDCFYEGKTGYLWIEYKWLPKTPLQAFTPKLSKLQLKWLQRAHKNEQPPWVVVGSPLSIFVLQNPDDWGAQVKIGARPKFTKADLARLIAERVLT